MDHHHHEGSGHRSRGRTMEPTDKSKRKRGEKKAKNMQPFQFSQPQQQSQPFGAGAAGQSTFGGFGGFGQTAAVQPQQQQQTFGSTFGASGPVTSSAAPAFGTGSAFGGGTGGFGAGSSFGTPQQSTGTTSLFGGTQQPTATAFGAATSTVPAFGATPQPSTGFGGTASTGFGAAAGTFGTGGGGSLFGTSQAQPTSTFGTGQSTFGTQSTGAFGSTLGSAFQTQPQQPSLFSASQPTGGFGQAQSTFGTTTTQSGGAWFGGSQPQQTSTFGGFGGGTGSLFSQPKTGFSFTTLGQPQQNQQLLQQQQQQSQQQQMVDEQGAFHQSIFGCCKFGDERDSILANLNFIQACWGAGKGYYNQGNMPVTYSDKNVFYRFNAVGYSFMYNDSNENGQVVIHLKKPHSKVCEEETQFITSLQNMIAKPNIFYKITASKAVNEEITVIILTADDKTTLRRIPAMDLTQVLLQPQFRQQLESLGVHHISPKVRPSPEQLKAYLDIPPAGLDPRVWKKAQEDNPDPENMIPIPLLGPKALKSRVDAQQKENHQHSERLRMIIEEITNLQNRHSNMQAEIKQLKQRSVFINHRIVAACVRTLILQRAGHPLQPDEENLRKQMIEMEKQLNSPSFRGRLNELMSHIRMQKHALEGRSLVKHSVEPHTLEQVKDFLSLQQGSIIHLVDTLKACVECVQRMRDDMTDLQEKNPST